MLGSGTRLLLRTADLEKGPIVPWKQAQVALKVNAVLLCFAMQQDDPRQFLALEFEALVLMRGIYFQTTTFVQGFHLQYAMPCVCCFQQGVFLRILRYYQ